MPLDHDVNIAEYEQAKQRGPVVMTQAIRLDWKAGDHVEISSGSGWHPCRILSVTTVKSRRGPEQLIAGVALMLDLDDGFVIEKGALIKLVKEAP